MSDDSLSELLRNPTLEGATAYWESKGLVPPENPLDSLAAVHNARLHWLEATNVMLEQSKNWLTRHNYSLGYFGLSPMTPERRDLAREILRKGRLNS